MNKNMYELRWPGAGLSLHQAAEFLGVSERHYRRLERGQVKARPVHYRLLELAGGQLGGLSAAWRGWRIDRDGHLWTPDYRAPFTVADVLAIPWWRAQIRAQGARLRELETKQCPQGAPSSRPAVRCV